jgi:hypothetical protein
MPAEALGEQDLCDLVRRSAMSLGGTTVAKSTSWTFDSSRLMWWTGDVLGAISGLGLGDL